MDFQPQYRNLVELYQQGISRFAQQPLFGTKAQGRWTWLSYAAFGTQVDELRTALAAHGVEAGDRIGILSNNRYEWAVIAYAAAGLGAAFVPMYESQPLEEWLFILRDCGAKLCFAARSAQAELLEQHRAQLPSLERVLVLEGDTAGSILSFAQLRQQGRDRSVPSLAPAREDLAVLIYTSGTTGTPKGVMLSHANIVDNVSAAYQVLPIDHRDRSLSFLPWAHCFGQITELHGLISVGGSMAIAESTTTILDNLAEIQPTVLVSVPRIFNRIYDRVQQRFRETTGLRKQLVDLALATAQKQQSLAQPDSPTGGRVPLHLALQHRVLDRLVFAQVRQRFGGRLRFAVSGGAALSPAVAAFIEQLGIRVYEGYGLSETSPVVAVNTPAAHRPGTVGRPIPGVRVHIAAHEADGDGEVVVYGHNVMQGYHNLPEENAAVFTADGGLRTGDLGHLDADGFLTITGRLKERYKLENGKYVAPVPLEEDLKLSPFIANVMIYGDNRERNVALVVPDLQVLRTWAAQQKLAADAEEAWLQSAAVRQRLKEEISAHSANFKNYEKIAAFAVIAEDFSTDNGLLTPSLKIRRKRIVERYRSDIEQLYRARSVHP